MPQVGKQKRSHEESQQIICALCLQKDIKCFPMTKKREFQVHKIRANTGGYSMNIHYYPTGICNTCYTHLCGKTVSENRLRLWHTPINFKTDKNCEECTVCSLAKSFQAKKDGRKKTNRKKSIQLCIDCFGEVGPGKHNNCNKENRALNMQKQIANTPLKTKEQITNTLLKEIHKEKKSPEGETISLSGCRGKPVPVTLGRQQPSKLNSITVEDIMKIKKGTKGSLTSTKFVCKTLRQAGAKLEPNCELKILEKTRLLSEFYREEKVTIKVKGKIVQRDLIYVHNIQEFIAKVAELRGQELYSLFCRIGIDSGGGSLKIIINLFNPDTVHDGKGHADLDSGINKSLVIAYCDGMPETHSNMELIFKRLNLHTVKHSLACDMKMTNLLAGISVSLLKLYFRLYVYLNETNTCIQISI